MIKADGSKKVKERLVLAIAAFFFASAASAEVSEKDVQALEQQEFGIIPPSNSQPTQKTPPAAKERKSPSEDLQPGSRAEQLRPIEAEEFNVRLVKTSSSGRVLLLEDFSENHPRPGKILLLKQDKEDVAAIRV
ncbi:MAG: hypothetical protein AB1540_04625, partial [Bdellovibrionota bacterium]